MFGIKNERKFVIWLVVNIVGILVLYHLCSTHESVEKKSYFDRLYLNYFEKANYRNRVFCSMNPIFLVLFAILLTFGFNANTYQTYALGAAFLLYFTIYSFSFK